MRVGVEVGGTFTDLVAVEGGRVVVTKVPSTPRSPDLGAFETLAAEADSDRDQMPDGWELANGLNPVVDDAAGDADGDRASNGDEYRAGTRPADPTSVLALRVETDPVQGGMRLEWFGVAGRMYAVEYADTLPLPAPWPILEDNLAGNDANLELPVPSAAGAGRYYRVRVR